MTDNLDIQYQPPKPKRVRKWKPNITIQQKAVFEAARELVHWRRQRDEARKLRMTTRRAHLCNHPDRMSTTDICVAAFGQSKLHLWCDNCKAVNVHYLAIQVSSRQVAAFTVKLMKLFPPPKL